MFHIMVNDLVTGRFMVIVGTIFLVGAVIVDYLEHIDNTLLESQIILFKLDAEGK